MDKSHKQAFTEKERQMANEQVKRCYNEIPISYPTTSKNFSLLLLLSHFSRVRLCVTPQAAAHQAPPSLGFSRQKSNNNKCWKEGGASKTPYQCECIQVQVQENNLVFPAQGQDRHTLPSSNSTCRYVPQTFCIYVYIYAYTYIHIHIHGYLCSKPRDMYKNVLSHMFRITNPNIHPP